MKKLILTLVTLATVFVGCQKDELEAQANLINVLESNVSTLEANLADTQADLATAEATIVSNNEEIAGLNSDLAAANEAIAGLEGDNAALSAEIVELQADLAALQTAFDVEAAKLETATAELAEVTSALASANGDISQLETRLGNAQAEIAAANAVCDDLRAQLAAAQARVVTVVRTVTVGGDASVWSPAYNNNIVSFDQTSSVEGHTVTRTVIVTPSVATPLPGESSDVITYNGLPTLAEAQAAITATGTHTIDMVTVTTVTAARESITYTAGFDLGSYTVITATGSSTTSSVTVDIEYVVAEAPAADPADTVGTWTYAIGDEADWNAGVIDGSFDTSTEIFGASRSRITTINGDADMDYVAGGYIINADGNAVETENKDLRNSAYAAPGAGGGSTGQTPADTVAPVLTASATGGNTITNNVINVAHDYDAFAITVVTNEGDLEYETGSAITPWSPFNGAFTVVADQTGSVEYTTRATDAAGNVTTLTITLVVAPAPAVTWVENAGVYTHADYPGYSFTVGAASFPLTGSLATITSPSTATGNNIARNQGGVDDAEAIANAKAEIIRAFAGN